MSRQQPTATWRRIQEADPAGMAVAAGRARSRRDYLRYQALPLAPARIQPLTLEYLGVSVGDWITLPRGYGMSPTDSSTWGAEAGRVFRVTAVTSTSLTVSHLPKAIRP